MYVIFLLTSSVSNVLTCFGSIECQQINSVQFNSIQQSMRTITLRSRRSYYELTWKKLTPVSYLMAQRGWIILKICCYWRCRAVLMEVEGRDGEAGKNYRGPLVRKGTRGPTTLHILLSFSVVSLFVDCTNEPFQTKPKAFCKWESVFPI